MIPNKNASGLHFRSYAERPGFANPGGVLPGLEDVDASFDGTSIPGLATDKMLIGAPSMQKK